MRRVMEQADSECASVWIIALVAPIGFRARRYERQGWEFESLRAHQLFPCGVMAAYESPKLLVAVRVCARKPVL